jgi:hypothetical protein
MTGKLLVPSIAALLLLTGEARAQLGAPYSYYGGGIGFQYSGGRLRLGGFLQSWAAGQYYIAPYAVMQRQIIVQPILQAPLERATAAVSTVPKYDLSGIDLDVESPDKLYPPGTAPLPMPKPVPPKKKEQPKAPEKLPAPMPEPVKPLPEDELLKPRPIPADEAKRLLELGIRAFRAGQYGVALVRFRQASEVDPTNTRALFLMGQAHMAVGQYRDALTAIESGLRLQPDWPISDYRPRLELYGDNPDDWRELVHRLEDAVRRRPDDAAALFLRAYTLWFDGERARAAQGFMRARAHTADPRWIDLFLKHAPPPVVAAS